MIEIPGYKIHRKIDNSDYCSSYSAIQLSSGKTMVVSVFSHSATQYTSFQSFFNNIEKKLAHQVFGVIAPIKEFIKTADDTYIISDLLSNSCRHIYKDKEPDIELILNQIFKIALSLNLYHQVGFYHGGISLDNLFHDSDNNLKLGLAGFNKNFSIEDKTIDLDEESYKAPEKEISQSKSRDFYALGVVLYELIFKQKPFIAKSIDHLNKLKSAAVIHFPHDQFNHLKPLFTALLNPNLELRIANADDFKHIAYDIGIQLDTITYNVKPLSTNLQDEKTIIEKVSKPIPTFYYAGGAVLVIALLAIIFIPSDINDSKTINDDINLSDNITEEPPIETSQYNSKIPTPIVYDETTFNQLFETARNEFTDKKYASSLMTINQALKLSPSSNEALSIQQQAKNELKIKATIEQIEQYVKDGFLVSPTANNAFSSYKTLQNLLPEGDARASIILNSIGDKHYEFAVNQLNNNDTKTALSTISTGLSISPNHNNLIQLKKDILQKQESTRTYQANLELKQLEKINEENRRIALLERKKQQQILKQREEKKQAALALKQQNINNLFAEAEAHLKDTQLTVDSIISATENFNSLLELTANQAKLVQLNLKIDAAYVSLTEYQISIEDYPLARSTINNGLQKNSQNIRLSSLEQRVDSLVAQSKVVTKPLAKKEKELPIFGTF